MQQKPPPPYPPGSYAGMPMETMMKKRYVLGLNGLALLALWFALLLAIVSGDLNVRGFARFLVISAGVVGAFGSLAGALGSKRTTDMQNLGLLIWAGLLLTFTAFVLTWMG